MLKYEKLFVLPLATWVWRAQVTTVFWCMVNTCTKSKNKVWWLVFSKCGIRWLLTQMYIYGFFFCMHNAAAILGQFDMHATSAGSYGCRLRAEVILSVFFKHRGSLTYYHLAIAIILISKAKIFQSFIQIFVWYIKQLEDDTLLTTDSVAYVPSAYLFGARQEIWKLLT